MLTIFRSRGYHALYLLGYCVFFNRGGWGQLDQEGIWAGGEKNSIVFLSYRGSQLFPYGEPRLTRTANSQSNSPHAHRLEPHFSLAFRLIEGKDGENNNNHP